LYSEKLQHKNNVGNTTKMIDQNMQLS